MRAYLTGIAALALVACGAPGDERAGIGTNADTASAFDPDYLVFASRADAETWVTTNADQFGGKPALVAVDDPRTVRLQTMITKHWPAIAAKFAPNIPAPFPLLIDSPEVNAFVTVAPPTWDQAPDAVFVYTGILYLDDTSLETVLLHEIGHLVTKNALQQYESEIRKDYQLADRELLGLATPNAPNAASQIEPYLNHTMSVGDSFTELDGVPNNSMYAQFLQDYLAQHPDAQDLDCTTLNAAVDTMQTTLDAGFSSFDKSFAFTAQQSADLSAAAQTIEATSVTCAKPPADVDLQAALESYWGYPAGGLVNAFTAEEKAIFAGKDALTGLFAYVRELRTQMRATEGAPTFHQLRQFSDEEDADDFAMTILHAEGVNAQQLGRQTIALFANPDDQIRCRSILASGAVPPYSLVDPHHGNCYRAFNANAVEAYFEAGGIGVQPTKAIARTPAAPSSVPGAALRPKPKKPRRIIID